MTNRDWVAKDPELKGHSAGCQARATWSAGQVGSQPVLRVLRCVTDFLVRRAHDLHASPRQGCRGRLSARDHDAGPFASSAALCSKYLSRPSLTLGLPGLGLMHLGFEHLISTRSRARSLYSTEV